MEFIVLALKNEKKEKKKIKTKKTGIVIPIVFTTILLSITLLFALPVFHILEIEIQGDNLIPDDTLIDASGIQQNQHFLSGMGNDIKSFFSGEYINAEQQLLNKIPEIKSANIYFSFPSKVIFEVEEKIEIGFIKIPDGYCTIDSNGEVVALIDTLPEDLPIIEGITVINATIGQPLEVKQKNYLANAMYAMSALIEVDFQLEGEKLINSIEKIEPTINDEILLTLKFDQKDFLVQCIKTHDLVEDLTWLKQMLNEKVLSNKESGIIDLRGENKFFRENNKKNKNTKDSEETNETNESNELNETNEFDETNEFNEMYEFNNSYEFNEIYEFNDSYEFNELNELYDPESQEINEEN